MAGEESPEIEIFVFDLRFPCTVQWSGSFGSPSKRRYRDYLAGKLWISWNPGKQEIPKQECELVHVSAEAITLREQAQNNAYALIQELFPRCAVMPFHQMMQGDSIDDMCLSVRSSNGLKRAGITTLGALAKRTEQIDVYSSSEIWE